MITKYAGTVASSKLAGMKLAFFGVLIAITLAAGFAFYQHYQGLVEKLNAANQKVGQLTVALDTEKELTRKLSEDIEGLNRLVVLTKELHRVAYEQKEAQVKENKRLQKTIDALKATLPTVILPPAGFVEPEQERQNSFKRIMVIWDVHCAYQVTDEVCKNRTLKLDKELKHG